MHVSMRILSKALYAGAFILISSGTVVAKAEVYGPAANITKTPFGTIDRIELGGDGIDELVAGAPSGSPPEVTLFRSDRSVIASFEAYETAFTGGVEVKTADIDADGKEDIITAPGAGGGPRIRIFDGYGNQKPGGDFMAFSPEQKGGLVIAPIGLDRGAPPVILAALRMADRVLMKIVDRYGNDIIGNIPMPLDAMGDRFRLFSIDLGGDGQDEIMAVSLQADEATLTLIRTDGSIINRWPLVGLANLDALSVDRKSRQVSWIDHERRLHTQNMYGMSVEEPVLLENLPSPDWTALVSGSFEKSGQTMIRAILKRDYRANRDDEKYIEISLADQRLRYYTAGVLVDEYRVSTGRPGAPTPTGTFKIENKFEKAWSRTAGLWMPKWMAFVPSGKYGLHQLPYWPDGRIEGESSLGRMVSGGCVRLGIKESEKLYDWAEIGTPVYIN